MYHVSLVVYSNLISVIKEFITENTIIISLSYSQFDTVIILW